MTHDGTQQQIVALHNTRALVLAGPGCGKTHILARRILYAHSELGVPFDDMLCLTFTNRAAREMESRITASLGYRPEGLFTGNIHRFCLRFLNVNGLLPSGTAILDEEDRTAFLSDELGLKQVADRRDFQRIAWYLYQTENGHPSELIRRPGRSISEFDIELVKKYTDFKELNGLIDFDDIILRTYTALMSSNYRDLRFTSYRWIQVDEVQDMTPLQLAIVERITTGGRTTSIFLGDTRQAIFSFAGAGGVALDRLRRSCSGRIFHLRKNYRSPRYLVELCNDVARGWLGISNEEYLPEARNDIGPDDALTAASTHEASFAAIASAKASEWLRLHPEESVAVLTRTNAEALNVSESLDIHGVSHLLLSGGDLFSSPEFKTIYAHLAVTADPLRRSEWATLLYRTNSIRTLSGARRLIKVLRDAAMSGEELMYADCPTSTSRLVRDMSDASRTIAVIDTETTGLDLFRDDVIQFSAVKLRGGVPDESSRISFFIESERPLPRMLGVDTPNPLYDLYPSAKKLTPEEGFARIAAYLDGCVVAGHNIDFDIRIIQENIRRRTSLAELQIDRFNRIDTLRLSRLLFPGRRSHTLGSMLDHLEIEGHNSHNADDDVAATAALMAALVTIARQKNRAQFEIRESASIRSIAMRFSSRYKHMYEYSRAMLERNDKSYENTLAGVMEKSHGEFVAAGHIKPVRHIGYVLRLVKEVVVDNQREHTFLQQLQNHLHDLLTYNESDLLSEGIADERLSVMTVHKAKGLEMDNVILYVSGENLGTTEDRARVLYVGLSRARKRLMAITGPEPDPIFASVIHHFRPIPFTEFQSLIRNLFLHRPK